MNTQISGIRERTTKDIIRFSFGIGYGEFLTAVVSALLNYYYVRTLGLSNFYFLIAQTIYAVYNALNDPFVGYFTNRRFKFTKKYGKTYPWIMIGGFGSMLMAILVYYTPIRSEIGLVFWMIFSLCLTDTFYSLFYVNHHSLMPVIFRSKKQRIKFGTIGTAISTFSMLLGFIIPEFGDISSAGGYVRPMIIAAGIGCIYMLIMRPSVKEEPALTEEMFRRDSETVEEGFFKTLKKTLKMKNFMYYILIFLCFQTLSLTAISSLPYFLEFVLQLPIDKVNSTKTLLILIEFIGVFISLPIWSIFLKKYEFKVVFGVCGILMSIFCLPMLFVTNVTLLMVSFFLLGLTVGGFWALLSPIFSDTMDEATVAMGKHEEGVFAGIRTFFARFALVIQAIIFYVLRGVTRFTPENMSADKITSTMRFGLRLEMVGISVVLVLISSIIFLMKYDLTGQKLKDIRIKLDNIK